jgi:hypothetical protein
MISGAFDITSIQVCERGHFCFERGRHPYQGIIFDPAGQYRQLTRG